MLGATSSGDSSTRPDGTRPSRTEPLTTELLRGRMDVAAVPVVCVGGVTNVWQPQRCHLPLAKLRNAIRRAAPDQNRGSSKRINAHSLDPLQLRQGQR